MCAMSGMLLLFEINLIEVTAFNFLDGTLGEKRNLLALYSASFSFFLFLWLTPIIACMNLQNSWYSFWKSTRMVRVKREILILFNFSSQRYGLEMVG
uniref:Uncharacterized protein n=1 Tax=Populus trichocarpa TaxID=3694 RepID=A0A2K2BYX8_POPTR